MTESAVSDVLATFESIAEPVERAVTIKDAANQFFKGMFSAFVV